MQNKKLLYDKSIVNIKAGKINQINHFSGFNSNIETLERFQSKALRMIMDAPWYVRIGLSEGISKYQKLKKKSALTALNTELASAHPNGLVVNLMELPDNRRLRRHLPNDLPTRFLM
jgi:hypothetical protein